MTEQSGDYTQQPFDADARCPKCAHDDIWTMYRANSHEYPCRGHSRGFMGAGPDCEVCKDEHFDRGCRRCSYSWREEVEVDGVRAPAGAYFGSPKQVNQ